MVECRRNSQGIDEDERGVNILHVVRLGSYSWEHVEPIGR